MILTPEQIAELREMEGKASPAPWRWDNPYEWADYTELLDANCGRVHSDGSAGGEYGPDIDVDGPDAALIATMRNLLPALLDDYEEMQQKIERLTDELDNMSDALQRCGE